MYELIQAMPEELDFIEVKKVPSIWSPWANLAHNRPMPVTIDYFS